MTLRVTERFRLRTAVLATLSFAVATSWAQPAEIRVGVIYDMTGPLATAGGYAAYLGTKYAVDRINGMGGVEGRQIKPIYVDAQSKVDVAINEGERLLNKEGVDILLGVFPSSQCVPLAQKVEESRKFMWATICTSSAVFKNRNLRYVFRPQVHSEQFGPTTCDFLRDNAKSKLGANPQDLRVAIIYEDSPAGTGISDSNETSCKAHGLQIVLKEGYSASTPDLSALVTKLKRARADVVLHTGQNQDITLFLRQAKEQGLKWKALFGFGAGYGQVGKLYATIDKDADYIFDVEPISAHLLDPATLAPGLGDLVTDMVRRYKADAKTDEVSPHLSMGFNGAWVFLSDVLPRAIRKTGSASPDALREAALATDIPEGGTLMGYGVKFNPPGHALSGQNARSSVPMVQYVGGKTYVVAPTKIRTRDPVLPLPKGHGYAP
jgi:branched-chain amino acid transport system substrate-binding protein